MAPIAQSLCGAILVVAPHKELCQKIELALSGRGHSVTWCTDAVDALACSAQREFDLIVVDQGLQEVSRVDLVGQIKARVRKDEVVIFSFNHIEPEEHAKQPREGFYLTNPSRFDDLFRTVDEVLAQRSKPRGIVNNKLGKDLPRNGKAHFRSIKPTLPETTRLIGQSRVMQQLFRTIERIAPLESNVLITGATGTGKELVARAIHDRSARHNQPFVDVNSSAIPDTLFETEFFGHQRGTFTGAHETRSGLFERASGGTLFLDEVDALNLTAQAKLLRVLQERHLRRLGGRENISVDVRIIAATGTNLKAAVANGAFRSDLYFRLHVLPLHVPPLRERNEDIGLLIDYFLQCHAERSGTQRRRFSLEAMRTLTDYKWPGNVRELENVIEYALAVGSREELGIDDLPPDMFGEDMDAIKEAKVLDIRNNASLAEVERRHIISVFNRCGRHHIKAAAALDIDRRTLYRKLQQYNLESEIKRA